MLKTDSSVDEMLFSGGMDSSRSNRCIFKLFICVDISINVISVNS